MYGILSGILGASRPYLWPKQARQVKTVKVLHGPQTHAGSDRRYKAHVCRIYLASTCAGNRYRLGHPSVIHGSMLHDRSTMGGSMYSQAYITTVVSIYPVRV